MKIADTSQNPYQSPDSVLIYIFMCIISAVSWAVYLCQKSSPVEGKFLDARSALLSTRSLSQWGISFLPRLGHLKSLNRLVSV
jgi:hypothetical protein